MDPVIGAANAVIAPWAQYGVVGAVVVSLGIVVVFLWRTLNSRTEAHMQAVQKCHDQTLDITRGQIDANNKLANAMAGLERVVDLALGALKK